MKRSSLQPLTTVSKETTYERLKTLSRIWLGDMTDIAEQR
jgi:hypothetical protein